jgi:DNA adenine methylase
MNEVTSPALRYHGGKFRMAPWVTGFFPPHRCYVEPFGGAASVLLHKRRSYAEVYNDLDGDIVNFFRVLRDPAQLERLIASCVLTPYAREEFAQAYEYSDEPVERARRLAIRASMGFGSAGATRGDTGFRVDTRRKFGTAQQVWARYPEHLAAIGQRFTEVLVENRPALDIITQHDGVDTLIYADPPYVLSTRDPRASYANSGYYRHEMRDEDHVELLQALIRCKGMVVISGYSNEIYNDMLAGWQRHETKARISAGRGTSMRMETLWLNPATVNELTPIQSSFFAATQPAEFHK